MHLACWEKPRAAKEVIVEEVTRTTKEEETMTATEREGAARADNSTKLIRQELRALSQSFRARHPWVARHQNTIGFVIFSASIAGTLACAVAYVKGALPAWICVPLVALFLSLLHELEHDLIHKMYFANNRVLYNLMMAGVWLFRPSTISPWVRRRLHLHHHKSSGTDSDLEERAITNGEAWGLRRLLMTADAMLALGLRPKRMMGAAKMFVKAQQLTSKEEKRRLLRENILGYFPLGTAYYALWHAFLSFSAVTAISRVAGYHWVPTGTVAHVLGYLDIVAVVILMPNALRTFCLHFVSSNIHYFGDVQPGNIVQQTQVWTAPWTWPFQLFCFNFGGTHAIHHFIVVDPFYVRQAIAKEGQAVLRKHGIRFNDFGTFKRGNRWTLEEAEVEPSGQDLTTSVVSPA